MTDRRHWDGRAVHVAQTNPAHDRRNVDIALTPEAAQTLIKSLGRLAQTTFQLPGDMAELKQALEFVITGDAASARAYRQMEAGKGMTPDGGTDAPERINRGTRMA